MKKILSSEKIKLVSNIIKVIITILLSLIFLLELGTMFYNNTWFSSPEYYFARNVLNFQSNLIIILLITCLSSLFLKKILVKLIWIVAFVMIGRAFYILPEMQRLAEIAECIDTNYCQEEDREWATYEECKKNDKAWNIDEKACDLSFTVEDCQLKFSGNWELPIACNQK